MRLRDGWNIITACILEKFMSGLAWKVRANSNKGNLDVIPTTHYDKRRPVRLSFSASIGA
ncbi:hypothetical protein DSM3645_27848 [Blastopirellula marina DSM 3645]|uniref:Uncharacterized protein n=1 Tax=Blastopirellula marina DSM 3645 TaxID=314230 RepID=A3ZX83_9BACT|nr:hypothetical protein DSM3645_27848 [Blastopirellula marina DSM 3645]